MRSTNPAYCPVMCTYCTQPLVLRSQTTSSPLSLHTGLISLAMRGYVTVTVRCLFSICVLAQTIPIVCGVYVMCTVFCVCMYVGTCVLVHVCPVWSSGCLRCLCREWKRCVCYQRGVRCHGLGDDGWWVYATRIHCCYGNSISHWASCPKVMCLIIRMYGSGWWWHDDIVVIIDMTLTVNSDLICFPLCNLAWCSVHWLHTCVCATTWHTVHESCHVASIDVEALCKVTVMTPSCKVTVMTPSAARWHGLMSRKMTLHMMCTYILQLMLVLTVSWRNCSSHFHEICMYVRMCV